MRGSFIARSYIATVVACLLALSFGIVCRADNPYSAQSAKAPDQPTPSSYDLDQVKGWTQQLDSATDKDLAPIVHSMAGELHGAYDGNYTPPVWFGVSSVNGCASLVPGLVRALNATPTVDAPTPSADAIYCLQRVGPAAAPLALPTLVKMYLPDSQAGQENQLDHIRDTIFTLCGGRDHVGTLLASLIASSPDPTVRQGAIAAVADQGQYANNSLSNHQNVLDSQSSEDTLHRCYAEYIHTMAQAAVNDTNSDVRLAALDGLRLLVEDNENAAAWIDPQPTIASMVLDVARPLEERQIAAEILARLQCSPSPIVPQILRACTNENDAIRSYAIFMLGKAAQVDAVGLQNAMLQGLDSLDIGQRRQAALRLRYGASALWGMMVSLGYSEPNPVKSKILLSSYQFTQSKFYFFVSELPANQQPEGLTRSQQDERRTALVDTLAKTVADNDPGVRDNAELALETIAKDTIADFQSSNAVKDDTTEYLRVSSALTKAAFTLEKTEPDIAIRLRNLASPDNYRAVARG